MRLRGKRIVIDELKEEDALFFPNWGKHENPLFYDYNYHQFTPTNYRRWFQTRNSFFQHYYGIYRDGRFIGYLGMKRINYLSRSSTLGLVMDPNFSNQGYASEAMELFLNYYFYKLRKNTMFLEVAKYNDSAIHLYKKLGFVFYGEGGCALSLSLADIEHPDVQKEIQYIHRDFFGNLWEELWKMKLTKEDFEGRG